MKRIIIIVFVITVGCGRCISAESENDSFLSDIDIHGFISQGYLQSEGNNVYHDTLDGTFQFNEFGINFSTDLTDRLRVGLQLFSRDLGNIGNNTIELDWAYGDYRFRDWLGFRAGKIKIPFGFYQETRDLDMVRSQIFLPQSVYNEVRRETYQALFGGSIYGTIDAKRIGEFTYQAQVGETRIPLDGVFGKWLEGELEQELNEFDSGLYQMISLEWAPPLQGLRLGIFVMGTDDINADFEDSSSEVDDETQPAFQYTLNESTVGVLSVEYTIGNLMISAEYLSLGTEETIMNQSREFEQEGYYGGLSYRLTDWFECGLYYAEYYPDARDKNGTHFEEQDLPAHKAWQKEWVLSTRFDLNDYWTVKIEGRTINGTALIADHDNPDGLQEDSFLLALKTTFSF